MLKKTTEHTGVDNKNALNKGDALLLFNKTYFFKTI